MNVRVRASNVSLILDTGATDTHLDPVRTAALQLKWRRHKADDIREKAGAATHSCDVECLVIGPVTTNALSIGSHDISTFNEVLKQRYDDPPMDGVLGGDVLDAYRAVIDYSGNRLFLFHPHVEKRYSILQTKPAVVEPEPQP